MKNAAKNAEALRSLYRRLTRDGQPSPMVKLDPLTALVRGAVSYDVSDAKADEAMRLIDRAFVDLNEFRVATDLEIAELLGSRFPTIVKRVEMITRALNMIFQKEHTLNLTRMDTISNRDIRQFLRDLPELHPFVDAFVMLFAFGGHTVPVDQQLLDYLCRQGVLGEGTSVLDAQKFLEHHLKHEECYEFYVVSRRAMQDEPGSRKKKAKA